jgi:drug/metabolite transporter (DMT)-like permease
MAAGRSDYGDTACGQGRGQFMSRNAVTLIASAVTLGTGIFWGFYWLPVRALAEMGLIGAWGTLAITLAAAGLLFPFAPASRRQLAAADPLALASIALGGAAFALYSVGFLYGRVAIIILLWFLSPVWSTLIGRYLMGWPTPRLRVAAIAVGLAGLALMLGRDGQAPLPHGVGEWMSLVGGVLWSFSTTGIRTKSDIAPLPAAFIFAVGATLATLVLAPMLRPLPTLAARDMAKAIGLAFATGGLWWGVSIAGLMWATVRLDPARVAILLMTEVLAGALSASFLANERLREAEMLGGALVLCAGVLEIWPARRSGRSGRA